MGSDQWSDARPAHRVKVASFFMAKSPVTLGQYQSCVDAGACTPPAPACLDPIFRASPRQPVVCVTWRQAEEFSRWVGGSLPSEAQWEYAARGAGRNQRYPWGDRTADCGLAVINERGFVDEEKAGCGRKATWPVCSKPAGNTAQGLCDMAGNVWEWVEDSYHDSYFGAPVDGSAWVTPEAHFRVKRAGSWEYDAKAALAVARDFRLPDYAGVNLGFRPCRPGESSPASVPAK